MALSITPAVDRWLYQTDAFTIIFKGFDDNGNQCTGEHLSIEYNITYDGTMPDLTTMTRTYSDASGIIAMTISKPCVISLYGITSRDINDPNKGESKQEICINYEITFQPLILNITATYNGPEVEVSDDFDARYLTIQAELSNGEKRYLSIDEITIPNYQIQTVGENIKTLQYEDPLLNMTWNIEFVVIGAPKLLSLEAIYIGPRQIMGARIFPEQVHVDGIFLVTLETTEVITLTPDEWFFTNIPIITEANDGVLIAGYRDKIAPFAVPYDIVESLRLNVWYEGAKIEVGQNYDPHNLVIFLVPPQGDWIRLNFRDCEISSYLVEKEGWNWYTLTYTVEFQKFRQYFVVPGVIYKDYMDLEFKVVYIDNITREETDLTEKFEAAMALEGEVIVDWNLFLRVVNDVQLYGLYIVTVPKLHGLSNQYTMDWEVLCINKTTLKANIKRIYKEEDKDGTQSS